MRTNFVTVTVMISKKCHSENYLISAAFKVLNNYEAHGQRHLKHTLQVEDFTDMDQRAC